MKQFKYFILAFLFLIAGLSVTAGYRMIGGRISEKRNVRRTIFPSTDKPIVFCHCNAVDDCWFD